MLVKKDYLVITLNVIISVFAGIVCVYTLNTTSKIAVINYDKVFEKFNMAKEMKTVGEKEFLRRSKVIDSLNAMLNNSNMPAVNDALMQQILFEKENLQNFGAQYAKEESGKIRVRIDSYAEKFSKDKKYNLVIGMQQNGNILYAEEGIDATNDFIIYINKQYEGIK